MDERLLFPTAETSKLSSYPSLTALRVDHGAVSADLRAAPANGGSAPHSCRSLAAEPLPQLCRPCHIYRRKFPPHFVPISRTLLP